MNLAQIERRLAKLEMERSGDGGPVCLFQTVDEETGARTPSDDEIASQESEAERAGRNVILFRTFYERGSDASRVPASPRGAQPL